MIVTGGNSGIGYQTSLQLALRHARVYIAGRSEERVNKAIEEMQRTAGSMQLDLRFLQLDLQNLKSVKAAAAAFKQKEQRLDILLNNAGIMGVPFELTTDGYELQWQVNYLSPYLFVSELLPLLLATASTSGTKNRVRIINLSSDMTTALGPKHIFLNDVNMTDQKGVTVLLQRYSHSKQASIRHAKELNDRYSAQGLTAYSLHPGLIQTNLQGKDPSFLGTVLQFTMKITPTVTPLEGSLTSLYAATSSEAPAKAQGKFILPVGKISKSVDKWLEDRTGNWELWEHSERAVRGVGA